MTPTSWSAVLIVVVLAAGCGNAHDPDGGIEAVHPDPAVGTMHDVGSDTVAALSPDERELWAGTWYEPSQTSPGDNVYFRMEIFGVHEYGFEYELEYREIPYGGNVLWSEGQNARFEGPERAVDPATGHVFLLAVDPEDRHARVIDVTEGRPGTLGWSDEVMAPEVADGSWTFDRSVYRAGFDCDEASTPIEAAICRNEVLAQGDLEMNELYRELMRSATPGSARSLRTDQIGFLSERNADCGGSDGADEHCLARLYADRLVALRQLRDPSLGDGLRFDAEYAIAFLGQGLDLRGDTAARLAMYPLDMAPSPRTVEWRVDDNGVVFEQTYAHEKIVWPCDAVFQYSDMLFISVDGIVWVAAHVNIHEVFTELGDHCVKLPQGLETDAGREALTIWMEGVEVPLSQFSVEERPSVDGFTLMSFLQWTEGVVPAAVGAWLADHPILTFAG